MLSANELQKSEAANKNFQRLQSPLLRVAKTAQKKLEMKLEFRNETERVLTSHLKSEL